MANSYGWEFLMNFIYLTIFLGIAMIIKLNFKVLQKHLIPTSIIAGAIGFVLGDEILGFLHYDVDTLEKLIYHLMAIGFIALALKDRRKQKSADNVTTGFFIVNTYLVQAIVGFSTALMLMYFVYPNLFPNVGLLLPLGFAQGPGQAYSTGSAWEIYDTFKDGGNIGLSVATIGFIWAILGGLPFMNLLVKLKGKGRQSFNPEEIVSMESDNEIEKTGSIPKSAYIDDFTVQIILIGVVYFISYGFLTLFENFAVSNFGTFGMTVSRLFWGFNFMFGTLFALLFRIVLDKFRKKKIIKVNYADNYLLQKISSASFDIMITASISAISISALKEYLVPVLIITTVGGLFTMAYVAFYCKRVYKEDVVEHMVALYGMWTGNITTGVALLKEIDPTSKTAVTDHLVLGSGVAVFLGIPLMVILAVPELGYATGNSFYYFLALLIFILYSAIMNIGMFRHKIFKKNRK
jgi:ESS family glutamate:Na+ symporter